MRIHCTIFNYQREDMLDSLVKEIKAFGCDYTIIDDGSDYKRDNMVKFEHTGKPGFWRKWDHALKTLKSTSYDLYIFLPNDYSNIRFETIIAYAKEYGNCIFNLANDGRTTCWNDRQARKVNALVDRVYFTDCGFFTTKGVLDMMGYFVEAIPESRFLTPNISSGVGQQLTTRALKAGIPMYLPKHSLVDHFDHESTMHPKERLKTPLVTNCLWIHQDSNYALGNFINITPIIKYIYSKTNRKVDVYFDTEYVKECYINSPYINILTKKPASPAFVSSALVCRDNTEEDFRFAFRQKIGEEYSHAYKPFIDEVESTMVEGKYAVILNGSGSEEASYVASKNPGEEAYIASIARLKDMGYQVIFTGSGNDANRCPNIMKACDASFIGDIRISLGLIQGADLVVGNDTGLVHAAGCFDKEMFIFWKNTPTVRVRNSGINSIYSQNWDTDFSQWVSRFRKIVIGIATMASRKNSLQRTLASLQEQTLKATEIYVYNNDVNEYDATDNGKFYPLTLIDQGVYFLTCDDDILYPKTYIEDMVKAIDTHKCIVTHHGRKLNKVEKNYYLDHTAYEFHKSNEIVTKHNKAFQLDVAGTGVMGFNTNYFSPDKLFYNERRRMSDLIFSLEAAKQGKQIILLPHKNGYLKDICDDTKNSCSHKEVNNNVDVKNQIVQRIINLHNEQGTNTK